MGDNLRRQPYAFAGLSGLQLSHPQWSQDRRAGFIAVLGSRSLNCRTCKADLLGTPYERETACARCL